MVLDDPAAAYFLLATEAHIRLYSSATAVRGDRTVLRRVDVPGRLRAAACFTVDAAPGIAALVDDGPYERLLVRGAKGIVKARDGRIHLVTTESICEQRSQACAVLLAGAAAEED